MIEWLLYQLPTPLFALAVVSISAATTIGAFEVAHRFFLHRFQDHDGLNDAISGSLGAIGVLYGVTVGLVAIDAWQRRTEAEHIVAQEAVAIQELYHGVRPEESIGRPVNPVQLDGATPLPNDDRDDTRKLTELLVSEYLSGVICNVWDKQMKGEIPRSDWKKLRSIRTRLYSMELDHEVQKVRYAAALQSLASLTELRRLRSDAATDRLSWVMWTTVLVGAAITMCLVSLFSLRDMRLHRLVIGLLSSFLGLVLLMILINDRPFLGRFGIQPEQYTELSWIIPRPESLPSEVKWSDFMKENRKEACKSLGYP